MNAGQSMDKSQRGIIVGYITDQNSGQPVFGSNIAIVGTDIRVQTDLTGQFTIPNVPAGQCTLQCTHPDYSPLANLSVMVEPGLTTQCDRQLTCKEKIFLNEPIVLLPLRLEIRKQVVTKRSPKRTSQNTPKRNPSISIANYTLESRATAMGVSEQFLPFEAQSLIRPGIFLQNEYWIRWYPDELHFMTPLGKINAAEKADWNTFFNVYLSHKNKGSVKGLYSQDPFNLSLETLKTFYGFMPGTLTDDEIIRCKEYDKVAEALIVREGEGVREALGWQELDNPEIKAAWIAFSQNHGLVRSRQIAKHMLDNNWDFDTTIEGEENEPIDLLIEQGVPIPTLPEDISLYTIKDRKAHLLVDKIAINRDRIRLAPTDLEHTHWMTDFQIAVREGMGIIIKDRQKVEQIDQADWLIAVGLNQTSDTRMALEEILRRNNAIGDLAIFPQDSPTNNSESATTPFVSLETDAEKHLQKTRIKVPEEDISTEIGDQIHENILDSHRLASIFKLASSTVSEMAGANLSEMTEAAAMASLLWTPCTVLFQELWKNQFSQYFNNWQDCDNFFTQHVRARGTLPIIRVGENPYGILPIISLQHCTDDHRNNPDEFNYELINFIKDNFIEFSQNLPKIDNTSDEDRYETLLEIIRCLPVSKYIDIRIFDSRKPFKMGADPEKLNCPLVRDRSSDITPCIDTPFAETAYLCALSNMDKPDFDPNSIQINKDSPLLKRLIKYFLSIKFARPTPPQRPTAHDRPILIPVKRGTTVNRPSSQNNTTIMGRVVDRSSGQALGGTFVNLKGTDRQVLTNARGEFAFTGVTVGDRSMAVSHSGYDTVEFAVNTKDLDENSVLNASVPLSPAVASGCNIVADAARLLKRMHPDKLEILLLETLDLFSHRVDAWLTGIANAKLIECQRKNTQSPPTGVFGWLEKPGQLEMTQPNPEFIQAPSIQQATTAAILRNAATHNGTDDDNEAFQINLSSAQIRKGLWYLDGIRQGHLSGELLGYQLERMIHKEVTNSGSQITEEDIHALRKAYPLSLQETIDSEGEQTSILTIIDGEAFLTKETDVKFDAIKNRLNQFKDAAADIALCEVVNEDSNIERRGAWLDFLDGNSLPPREEFIRSHRTGDVHGTKIFLPILSSSNVLADEWITNPRSIADPILSDFCQSLMPDLDSKEIVAELTRIDGTQTRPIVFFARELNMDPIDLVIGGIEELTLRTRYYLLSCWQKNNPTDLTTSSPCNILGEFPDFDGSDELLNEVTVKLVQPISSDDTLSIFTCIEKANLIRNLIHKNQSKNSKGTVHPDDLPLIKQEQLSSLDPLASLEVLSKRLKMIVDRLVDLMTKMVTETCNLKRRYLVLQGLQAARRMAQKIKVDVTDGEDISAAIHQAQLKFANFMDADPEFSHLAANKNVMGYIEKIQNELPESNAEVEELFGNLNSDLLDIETDFTTHLQNTTRDLVSNQNLPLFEISQFGLIKALTVLPENLTITACGKIIKLFDQLITSLIDRLSSIVSDSLSLRNYLQCLKVVYLNPRDVNEIFILHGTGSITEKFSERLPLTTTQSEILSSTEFLNSNYFEPLLEKLVNEIKMLTSASSILQSEQNIEHIISLLQEATDKEGMAILTPYLLVKDANGSRPDWQLNSSDIAQLDGQAYLQAYTKIRPAISTLFSLFKIGQDLHLFEDKRYQHLDPSELSGKKEGNTDCIYLFRDNERDRHHPYLSFILIDEWQEGIPNDTEITGVALRYEAPKAEAPNAIIVAVPPYSSSSKTWDTDLLADTLLETIELMQIRMVGSDEFIGRNFLGVYLPALLFPQGENSQPLFPSKEKLLFGFEIGKPFVHVLNSQLSKNELLASGGTVTRTDTPQVGENIELKFLGETNE